MYEIDKWKIEEKERGCEIKNIDLYVKDRELCSKIEKSDEKSGFLAVLVILAILIWMCILIGFAIAGGTINHIAKETGSTMINSSNLWFVTG